MIQPKKIFRTKEGKLGFEWNDGTRGACDVRSLRLACPCALCVDEHSGEKILDDSTVPLDVKLEKVQSIGRYAFGNLPIRQTQGIDEISIKSHI